MTCVMNACGGEEITLSYVPSVHCQSKGSIGVIRVMNACGDDEIAVS